MKKLVRRIAAAKPDVLFVSAYLEDAIALRRQLVAQHVPLFANIGTSSSYCMPAFGATLGEDAVGVYASDKPSASTINPAGLRPDARALLQRANDAYDAAWNEDMSPAALAGFSAAWALFTDVLPAAASHGARRRRRRGPRGRPAAAGACRTGAACGSALPAHRTPATTSRPPASSGNGWRPANAAVIWPPAFATQPMDPSASDAW